MAVSVGRIVEISIYDRSPLLREPSLAGELQSLKAILILEGSSASAQRLIFISADGLTRPMAR